MNITGTDKRNEILQKIKEYTLFADEFMSKFFEDRACAQYLLRTIMGKPDLIVVKVDTQYDIKNLTGRAVRLDILCKDNEGHYFNVEVQRQDSGAGSKRARYRSSLIDANILDKGQDHDDLPETYVIFITEHDIWKAGLPVYHIERVVKELNVDFYDEAHIIYVNGEYRGTDEIGSLMHDFSCSNPDDMNNKLLSDRARYLKMTEEGVDIMSKSTEEMFIRWMDEEKRDSAIKMLKDGSIAKDKIASFLGISQTTVDELEKELLQMA